MFDDYGGGVMFGIVEALSEAPVVSGLLAALRPWQTSNSGHVQFATSVDDAVAWHIQSSPDETPELLEPELLSASAAIAGVQEQAITRRPRPASGKVAAVFSGSIVNIRPLSRRLTAAGRVSEGANQAQVIASLASVYLDRGEPPAGAVAAVLRHLEGAFAIAFLFAVDGDLLIGAAKGAPLWVGFGEGEASIASDPSLLIALAQNVAQLETDDIAILSRQKLTVVDGEGMHIERATRRFSSSARSRTEEVAAAGL